MSGLVALAVLIAAPAFGQSSGMGGTYIPQATQNRQPGDPRLEEGGRTLTGWIQEHEARNNPQERPAGSISADELRHPMSAKAAKLLRRAESDAHAGQHQKAIAELRELLQKEPSSEPYARSVLGAEYLRTKQVAAAVEELTAAVRLLPHSAPNHANLGYALYLAGDVKKSVEQVRLAVAEDPQNRETRSLLDQLLSNKPSETAEK